jgi:hypothetical protein
MTARPHQPPQDFRIFYHIGCWQEKMGQDNDARESWEHVLELSFPIAWEIAGWYTGWRFRYFQALAHQKLGHAEQSMVILDAIEMAAKYNLEIPYSARRDLMNLVARARLMPEEKWDPGSDAISVTTRAEL